jgi:hypothetical protein
MVRARAMPALMCLLGKHVRGNVPRRVSEWHIRAQDCRRIASWLTARLPGRNDAVQGRTVTSYAATSVDLSPDVRESATSYAPGANTSAVMNAVTIGLLSTVVVTKPLRDHTVSPLLHVRIMMV